MFKESRCRPTKYSVNSCDVSAKCDLSAMVCPFSWVEVVKPKEYFSLLLEEKVRSEVQSKPCLLSKCKLFNTSEGICKLMAYK